MALVEQVGPFKRYLAIKSLTHIGTYAYVRDGETGRPVGLDLYNDPRSTKDINKWTNNVLSTVTKLENYDGG